MPKLTKCSVEGLQPKAADYLVFDSELAGFGVRVMPSGRKSYLVQYRSGGRTRRFSLGQHGALTAEEARKEAMKRLGEVAKGGNPSEEASRKRRAPTVAALCDQFAAEYMPQHCKPRTAFDYQRVIDRFIRPRFGSFKIADLTRADVAELHHALRATPYQANRVLSVLSKMFNQAELWGLRPDGSNPCRLVRKFAEQKKERYLSDAELVRLGDALAEMEDAGAESVHVIAAFRLLMLTGCRLREIQTLRWADVTPTHLLLPNSKTGARRIPLPPAARAVLDDLPCLPENPYVIAGKLPGSHIADLERPWRRVRARAGLDDVRIHDLRHTYASMAVSNGIDLLTVGKILGHSNFQTTMRYAHLSDDPQQRAAEQISGRLAGAIVRTSRAVPPLRVVK
jgi:integrase